MRYTLPLSLALRLRVSALILAIAAPSLATPILADTTLANGSGDAIAVTIDDTDAIAALDGINIALAEAGDGGSYVWRRQDGLLSGMAQPTVSYKNAAGQPCRHLIVKLNSPARSATIEGNACRTAAGQWLLEG